MKWLKKGVIYKPTGDLWWARTHAMIPTPTLLNENTIRIYLSSCDDLNVARVGYVDIDSNNPENIIQISNEPVLDVGKQGTFDDNGVLACSIIDVSDKVKYMYYAGFELSNKIRYRILTGLAISNDGGETFTRYQKVPVLERSSNELYFRGGPFVIRENDKFKLWYVAGSDWMKVHDKLLPVYEIKYLESSNGYHWPAEGKPCISIDRDDEHGFGRPFLITHEGKYKIFYSVRRKSIGQYRLGYAESSDCINWVRKDEEVGLDVSDRGWDSEAIMYQSVISIKDKTYAFYNGNDFGKTGFGYAELIKW